MSHWMNNEYKFKQNKCTSFKDILRSISNSQSRILRLMSRALCTVIYLSLNATEENIISLIIQSPPCIGVWGARAVSTNRHCDTKNEDILNMSVMILHEHVVMRENPNCKYEIFLFCFCFSSTQMAILSTRNVCWLHEGPMKIYIVYKYININIYTRIYIYSCYMKICIQYRLRYIEYSFMKMFCDRSGWYCYVIKSCVKGTDNPKSYIWDCLCCKGRELWQRDWWKTICLVSSCAHKTPIPQKHSTLI